MAYTFDEEMKSSGYSLNYVCFECRKAYKQPTLRRASGHYVTSEVQRGSSSAADEIEQQRHNCPQCGKPMTFAGRNAVIPPSSKDKDWQRLEKELERRTSGCR